MHRHPCQNLHWYPLTSSKNIWPNISVAYFTKWFQPIFTVGGWRMYRPFNFRLLAPAYKPTQSCKRASCWSLNPARARNHKPTPGSSPTFIFEARFRPESQIYKGSYVAVTLARPLHVSKDGQSKKGKTNQATLISDFHAHGSESTLWPICLARS